MRLIRFYKGMFVIVMIVLLCACHSVMRKPKSAVRDGQRATAEIRALVAQSADDSIIDAQPLRNPVAVALLEQARAAESQGDFKQAIDFVARALLIEPNQPEHLQFLAELNLQLNAFRSAVDYARQSYTHGPQLGQLCYRNWLTLSAAWQALDLVSAANAANKRAQQCHVKKKTTY